MTITARQPVIIIGMHRSGTTMLTKLLEDLGLFMGEKKEENNEAVFFLSANNWFLYISGGAWDYPQPIHNLIGNQEVRWLVTEYARFILRTPHVSSFLGVKRYLHYHSPEHLDIPWGWKDPRNTFALPLWLDIFPDARVVHIHRHGIDVASSLKVRLDRQLKEAKAAFEKRKPLYCFKRKRGGFVDTLRCDTLEGGFSLWEEYLNEARRHVENLGARAMSLKYEDFLENPVTTLAPLARFCGLSVSDEEVARVAGSVKKGRSYSYRDKPELKAFADQVADRLASLGY
jgi:hypothetical protein